MRLLNPSGAHKNRIFTLPRAGSRGGRSSPGRVRGNIQTEWRRPGGRRRGRRGTDLGGEDGEVDAGEALEVLLEEALGVVLPDLLARHGEGRREGEGVGLEGGLVGDWRWACRVHVSQSARGKNRGWFCLYIQREDQRRLC